MEQFLSDISLSQHFIYIYIASSTKQIDAFLNLGNQIFKHMHRPDKIQNARYPNYFRRQPTHPVIPAMPHLFRDH